VDDEDRSLPLSDGTRGALSFVSLVALVHTYSMPTSWPAETTPQPLLSHWSPGGNRV